MGLEVMNTDGPASTYQCQLCGEAFSGDRIAAVYIELAPGEDVSDAFRDLIEVDICGFPMKALVGAPPSRSSPRPKIVIFVCGARCAAIVHGAAAVDAIHDGREPDLTSDTITGLRRWRRSDGFPSDMAGRLNRFAEVVRLVAPDLADRLGLSDPDPVYTADASAVDRRNVEGVLSKTCAWCSLELPTDDRVQVLYVRVGGPMDDGSGRLFRFLRVGDRAVPARVVDGGAEADLGDAALVLCGTVCRQTVEEAIDGDLVLDIVQ